MAAAPPPEPDPSSPRIRLIVLFGGQSAEHDVSRVSARDALAAADPDRYDIHRKGGHLSFGQGLHFCLGSALARMQARVVLEEALRRWPDWEVDYDNAEKAHTSSVRGWSKLPVNLG